MLPKLPFLAAALAAFALNAGATPLTRCLGYPDDARLAIVNADDVGMHPDLDRAAFRLLDEGKIQELSLMAPAPHFTEAAAAARQRHKAVGLHLTLTDEWQDDDSWGAVLPREQVPSLYNPQGRLWGSIEELAAHADIGEVRRELLAQIQKARDAGLTITHLDTHMVFWRIRNDFINLYLSLPRLTGIPVVLQLLWHPVAQQLPLSRSEQQRGNVVADSFVMQYNPESRPQNLEVRYDGYDFAVRNLPPGLHHFAVHPAEDSPEARRQIGDLRLRLSDFQVWEGPEIHRLMKEQGIETTDYQRLKALQEAVNRHANDCLNP
ncbi:polysaccharide deacetylase family protein [Pseudogulbenkiania sp. MAI-1]|uniref:polysaccharide deacetylase family protein n=1 Tax=Pseudogulbenkiania sp. MAI-1 TaxID=990370 RepID=UPI00045E6FC2|nr:polysaccharide deacetylase family protein [Pseudogulbenkiania sp. MAI-1]